MKSYDGRQVPFAALVTRRAGRLRSDIFFMPTACTSTASRPYCATTCVLALTISWGYDTDAGPNQPKTGTPRYQVTFDVSRRHPDLDPHWAPADDNDTPQSEAYIRERALHEEWQLDNIYVNVRLVGASAYSRLRRYQLAYADPTTAVESDGNGGGGVQPVLTLMGIQVYGTTDGTRLPPTTFTYYRRNGMTGLVGGLNRLKTVNNGLGGEITFTYALVWPAPNPYEQINYHRVTEVERKDVANQPYSRTSVTTYTYSGAALNNQGNSAAVYYANYPPGASGPLYVWAHPEHKEFRGHAQVITRDYDVMTAEDVADEGVAAGQRTLRRKTVEWFIQGNFCDPGLNGNGDVNDQHPCWPEFVARDMLKGRTSQVEVFADDSATSPLQRTEHTYERVWLPRPGYDPEAPNPANYYTSYQQTGLWRSFNYLSKTIVTSLEGQTSGRTHTTEYFYHTPGSWKDGTTYLWNTCISPLQHNLSTDIHAEYYHYLNPYGNLGCVKESQNGTLVRRTRTLYGTRNETSGGLQNAGIYFADRRIQAAISDPAGTDTTAYSTANPPATGNLLSLLVLAYDDASQAPGYLGTRGLLVLERSYRNVPFASSTQGLPAQNSRDVTYGYDAWGNRTSVTTYAGEGTRIWPSGGSVSYSAPGNGSAARTTTTTYDTTFRGYPTTVTNPLNQTETADYDYLLGVPIKVIAMNGTAGGNPNCTLASFSVPATSAVVCAQYDELGRITKLVKPGDDTAAPTVAFTYGDLVVGTSSPPALPIRYVTQRKSSGSAGDLFRDTLTFYDGRGRLVQTKEESGAGGARSIVVDTRYNAFDQVVAQSQPEDIVEPNPATSFWVYTSRGLFRRTWTAYDALQRVRTVKAPDTTSTTTSYNLGAEGVQVATINARGHCTRHESDPLGRLRFAREYSDTSGCATLYATTTYSYDALDRLTGVTDALGNATTLGYDSLGQKTAMTDPDMGAWQYAYTTNGQLDYQVDAKNQTIDFSYDTLDRLTSTTMPGQTRAYTYDATSGGNQGIGRRTGMSVTASGATQSGTTWVYDARGRSTQASHTNAAFSGSRMFAWTYDSGDRVQTLTYPSGEVIRTWYDAAWREKRLCSETHHAQCTTETATSGYAANAQYTALNQPDGWTLGNGLTVDWTYTNPMARLERLRVFATSDVLNRRYQYDAVGNVEKIWNEAAGEQQTLTFGYDHRNRLTSAAAVDGLVASAPGQSLQTAGTAPGGGAASISIGGGRGASGSIRLPLAQTNPIQVQRALERLRQPDVRAGGDPTTPELGRGAREPVVAAPLAQTGVSLKVQYRAGNPSTPNDIQLDPYLQIVNTGTTSVALSDLTIRYWYTNDGPQSQTYNCDYAQVGCANVIGSFGQPTAPAANADRYMQIGFTSGAGSLAAGASSGPVQSRVNKTDWSPYTEGNDYSYNPAFTTLTDWTKVTLYSQGTLIWGVEPLVTPVPYADTYAYDLIGNLTNKDGTGIAYGANGTGTGAGPHQARTVGGLQYSYDATGNLLSGGGRSYTWAADNQPASITSGGVTESYTYTADGARVTKVRNGVTTLYLAGLWEETSDGLSRKAYYVVNGAPVAVRDLGNTQVTYLHGDHLGSVSVATDAAGQLLSRQYFDPWGTVLSGRVPQTQRSFTGQYLDDTGLLFYHARYYDPALGRFISPDTVVPDARNPQTLNRYSYVLNNPINYTDPTGHCAVDTSGNISRSDCTDREFESLSAGDRIKWMQAFQTQFGYDDWFHNIEDIIAYFSQSAYLPISSGSWASWSDAGVLAAIQNGRVLYEGRTPVSTSGGAAGLWRDFFVQFNARKPQSTLKTLWAVAEQGGVNYGIQLADTVVGRPGGVAGNIISNFITAGDAYRGAASVPYGGGIIGGVLGGGLGTGVGAGATKHWAGAVAGGLVGGGVGFASGEWFTTPSSTMPGSNRGPTYHSARLVEALTVAAYR